MLFKIVLTFLASFFWAQIDFASLNNKADDNFSVLIEKEASQILPHQKASLEELTLQAESSAVLDPLNDIFIFEKNSLASRQIASITKLMTALVVLDENPDWNKVHKIEREDRVEGGKIHLYYGDEVTIKDLFLSMLVGSENTASLALVHALDLSEDQFVEKMNTKAREMGLLNTSFSDVVGLSPKNVSTARDVAFLAKEALSREEIKSAVGIKKLEFETLKGVKKEIDSTDYLLSDFDGGDISILGGKTGYTELAGYCLVAKFMDPYQNEVISVVLGSPTEVERFRQTSKLVKWIYNNFEWRP